MAMTEDELKKQFGRNLLRMRRQFQMTQQDLALRLEVSSSQIAKIESGKSGASFGILAKLMSVFNCTPADLFDCGPHIAPPDIVSSALNALRASANCVEIFTREYQELKGQIKLLKTRDMVPANEMDQFLMDFLQKKAAENSEDPNIPQVSGE